MFSFLTNVKGDYKMKFFDFSINDINEKKFINYINSKKPFLIVSLMNSQIYKKKTLDNINSKIVNFHTGILPKYRGIYPNFYSILHNEKKSWLNISSDKRKN